MLLKRGLTQDKFIIIMSYYKNWNYHCVLGSCLKLVSLYCCWPVT